MDLNENEGTVTIIPIYSNCCLGKDHVNANCTNSIHCLYEQIVRCMLLYSVLLRENQSFMRISPITTVELPIQDRQNHPLTRWQNCKAYLPTLLSPRVGFDALQLVSSQIFWQDCCFPPIDRKTVILPISSPPHIRPYDISL